MPLPSFYQCNSNPKQLTAKIPIETKRMIVSADIVVSSSDTPLLNFEFLFVPLLRKSAVSLFRVDIGDRSSGIIRSALVMYSNFGFPPLTLSKEMLEPLTLNRLTD